MNGFRKQSLVWKWLLAGLVLTIWSMTGCTPPEKKEENSATGQETTTDGGASDDNAGDASTSDGSSSDGSTTDEPPKKTSSAPVPEGFVNTGVFVDTEWLEKNLSKIRVLDIRSEENFKKGHIPGAVHFPRERFLTTINDIPNMVVDAKTFGEHLRKAGVAKETHVIVVDDNNMLWGSRLHWTLDFYGVKASSLHGGFAAWVKDNRDVTTDISTYDATEITVTPNKALISDYAGLLDRVGGKDKNLIVLDTRSKGEHDGSVARSKHGGHIPGSVHIEWSEHLVKDSNPPVLRPVEELKELYLKKGVTKDKEIASYCQTAIRATHTYLVLKALGYENVKIYDGSWFEWGNKDDSPKTKN